MRSWIATGSSLGWVGMTFLVAATVGCRPTAQPATPHTAAATEHDAHGHDHGHEHAHHGHDHGDDHDHARHDHQAHSHQQESGHHDHSAWWCDLHGVPEADCSRCSAKVAARFQQDGDWCEEHDRAKSQCFPCNPKVQARYAAIYRAKFGEEPPVVSD